MFDNIFSFSGRIGRVTFFLQSLVIGVCGALIAFGIALLVFPARHQILGLVFLGLCLLVLAPTMLWISFAMQARRFRDIGWDPLYVIPGWIVVSFCDAVVVHLYPALSVGAHRGTIVGALVNLALSLALLFWPGRDDDEYDAFQRPKRMTRVESLGYAAAGPSPEPRAPAPRTGSRGTFGRRGV